MAKEKCDNDCATCDLNNRVFCSVKIGMQNTKDISDIRTLVVELIKMIGANESITPSSDGEDVPKTNKK